MEPEPELLVIIYTLLSWALELPDYDLAPDLNDPTIFLITLIVYLLVPRGARPAFVFQWPVFFSAVHQ
jgi:hypothetical protein